MYNSNTFYNLGNSVKVESKPQLKQIEGTRNWVYVSDEPFEALGPVVKLEKKPLKFCKTEGWLSLRYDALVKYGRRCVCCGITSETAILHVDHIKPKSLHPELALDINNLQILCHECNFGKGNRDDTDLRY